MSDYIIHNIDLPVTPQCDFNHEEDSDKPVAKYPNHYLGKVIGEKGNVLRIYRTRRGGGEEHVPNYVLRNEGGIALIRIHNKEIYDIIKLPEDKDKDIGECPAIAQPSYPFAYVVVDYRDGRCQIAIEKSPSWDSKTDTIKVCLKNFFNNSGLLNRLGVSTDIKEKTERKAFEQFIDQRTMNHGDMIESFTFEYVNLKKKPTARIPKELTEEMELHTKILEYYGAVSGMSTVNMESAVDRKKLYLLSRVVEMVSDNAWDLKVKLRDFGEYSCRDGVIAKYPMNDAVISYYKDFITPDIVNSDFDLRSWLDDVFTKVKEGKDGEEIPTKPME